jgi:predicted Zn finger-like uncharacterized protein
MNVACPSCRTIFRIDPGRVPPAGVRVRCDRCPDIFLLTRGGAEAVREAAPQPPPPAGMRTAPPTATPAAHAGGPTPPAPEPVPAVPAAPAAPAAPPRPPAAGAGAGAGARGRPAFGTADPGVRAQRLARALVSDIVAYHPQRRERGLREGTLRSEFREEIMKSWEEYVEQVGDALARGTPYFRNALNEILAAGRKTF